MCTICGATLQGSLQGRPSSQASQRQQQAQGNIRVPRPGVATIQLQRQQQTPADVARATTAELQHMLGNLRERIHDVDDQQHALLQDLQDFDADINGNQNAWQEAPAEAMDPTAAAGRSRPTSKAALDNLPRITLTKESFLFRRAGLSFNAGSSSSSSNNSCRLSSMEAVPGEFGSPEAFALDDATLILAQPRTGKGGLSVETVAAVKAAAGPVIVYMERGDGLTFVAKAVMAQQAGAAAVVMGNNISQPWPYIMKDTVTTAADDAAATKLTIPIVMVKQADAQSIVAAAAAAAATDVTHTVIDDSTASSCRLDISGQSKDCVVCRDEFGPGQIAVRLPACNHVFHEQCAMLWLSKHNTCPYCRRELPTDDEAYEQERRRTQRTHAGSETVSSSSWHDFYG